MPEITRLLDAAAAGDCPAAADLLPLVYDELRKLAAARMAAETPGHILDATALVDEAYLRSVGNQHFDGKSRCSPPRPRRCGGYLSPMSGIERG
jgi:hypothetical protein